MTACTATSFLEWVYGSENDEVRIQKLKWIPALVGDLVCVAVRTPHPFWPAVGPDDLKTSGARGSAGSKKDGQVMGSNLPTHMGAD